MTNSKKDDLFLKAYLDKMDEENTTSNSGGEYNTPFAFSKKVSSDYFDDWLSVIDLKKKSKNKSKDIVKEIKTMNDMILNFSKSASLAECINLKKYLLNIVNELNNVIEVK